VRKDVLAWNLIPATLGNFLGGLLFAMGQFAVYGDYARPQIEQLATRHAVERQVKKESAAAR
jgi:membrane protein YqaA with SNARE-associated domain